MAAANVTSARVISGPLMVLIGGICIGFAPIAVRYGLDSLGPQAIALWRYVLALPVLYALMWIRGGPRPKAPGRFVILAALFFTLDLAFWHWALSITTVANATFLVNLGSILVGFLAWLVLKEKPVPIWYLAVLIAISGAMALSFGGGENSQSVLAGDLLAMFSALMIAGYILCSKIAREKMDGLATIFWLTFFEVIFQSFVVVLSGETVWPQAPSGFAAPLFLALIVQIAGQGLIVTGLGRTPAAIAGLMIVIQPVVAAILAWILFEEPLLPLQILGAALIVLAIILSHQALSSDKPAAES